MVLSQVSGKGPTLRHQSFVKAQLIDI